MSTALAQRLQTVLADAYLIERELTGGGMSRLFLATERSLNRQVVIKLLPPELASEVSAARFAREIELAAQLQHPHVLPVLAAGERDGLLYYVMPYVTGESLRQRLVRAGRLPLDEAIRILREVADALAYAHRHGVVHRDIKPENILLQEDHAVLADFGVARALVVAKTGERLTEAGISIGTPGYMSPEQAAGDETLDARSDIYALATVGYEMLAGRPPFTGPTAGTVLAAHLRDLPQPLVALHPEIPVGVSAAIARALAKPPEERFQSAAEFRDALESSTGRAVGGPRVGRRWVAAASAAIVLAVGGSVLVLGSGDRGTLDANLVAVAPFEVFDPGLRLWHEGLVDILSRNLDGAGPLRTVSPTVVMRRWSGRAEPTTAAELGRRTGAGIAIFGSLVGAGADSVRLRAALVDVASARVLGEVERRDVAPRIDRLADSLTVALLRELGRTRTIRSTGIASVGSSSLPALKAFLQGEQHFRRTAWDSAIANYERAIALDSTFALAFSRLGLTLGWQRSGFDSLARAYLLRAGALNRGLAPRDSLLLVGDSLNAVVLALDDDVEYWSHNRRLFAAAQETARRYPRDPEAWYGLGETLFHFGFGFGFDASPRQTLDAFDRAIALDSAFAPAYIHPVELALTLDDPAAAKRYARAYLALHPTDVSAQSVWLIDELLESQGTRSAEAQRLLDTLSADVLARAGLMLARWPDSAETAVELARLITRGRRAVDPAFSDPVLGRGFLAIMLAQRGHVREAYLVSGASDPVLFTALALLGGVPPDTAANVFARWLRSRTAPARLALRWWAARGDTGSIDMLLRRARSVARSTTSPIQRHRAQYDTAAAQAYLALARRDTAAALRRFEALADTLCVTRVADKLTKAQLLASRGRDREANELLSIRLLRFPSPLEVEFALQRARGAERLGERERAIDAYAYVAGMWRGADPDLRAAATEAREALLRLSADRARGAEVKAARRP